MPKSSLCHFCDRARRDKRTGDDTTKERAVEVGAARLLTKPVDLRSLRQEIDHRLEQAA